MTTPPGDGQQGWYAGPPAAVLPPHPNATKAMVIGIVALVGGFMCFLPLALGPWAWVVGRSTVREIDAQPGQYDGRGQAQAGFVLGVIATVLLLLGLLLVIGLLSLLLIVPGGPVTVEGRPL